MTYEQYFPRGVAKRPAFFDRDTERKRLANNINTGQHTLLMSPRRYGKTSLVEYVIEDLQLPASSVDLFVAVNAKHIEQQILSGIKTMMNRVCSSVEQLIHTLRDYFKQIDKQWTIGTQGVSLVLSPSTESDPAMTIMDGLLALEHLLCQKKKKGVLFLDEMQEIGQVAEGKGIEGAIRHVAQQTRYLSLVFSGSNRHLLSHMFYDKARPLYKLCDRIMLERIHKEEYIKHLLPLSHQKWRTSLTTEALEKLFELTERHPYYMNTLCYRLWESDQPEAPNPENITLAWLALAKEEHLEIARELSALSTGQRKILINIAAGTNTMLRGKTFLNKIDMTSSAVTEALQILEQKDYIQKNAMMYSLIDPLIKTMLNLYFGEV